MEDEIMKDEIKSLKQDIAQLRYVVSLIALVNAGMILLIWVLFTS
jgi:hypothetical protein